MIVGTHRIWQAVYPSSILADPASLAAPLASWGTGLSRKQWHTHRLRARAGCTVQVQSPVQSRTHGHSVSPPHPAGLGPGCVVWLTDAVSLPQKEIVLGA